MKLLSILMAEKIIVDERTADVSAISLIEAVGSLSFPFFLSNPMILISLHKDADDAEESEGILTFLINEEEIAKSSFVIAFDGRPRTRTVIQLNGIGVPKPGHLRVCVDVAGRREGEWDTLVTQTVEDSDESSRLEESSSMN